MLTHNFTDTVWFHEAINAANAICFTKGRVGVEKAKEISLHQRKGSYSFTSATMPVTFKAFSVKSALSSRRAIPDVYGKRELAA